MHRIKDFFNSLDSQRALLAALISAVFAWTSREPFTAMVLAGKAFAGRGLPMQTLMLGVYFLLFFAIFLFLLAGLTGFLLRHARAAIAALALIPLAAHAWMGSYSRFVSDDFSSAALAARLGVWGAAVDWYVNWTGRFSANIVDSLTGALGQKALGWQVLIVLLLWLAALTLVFSRLIPHGKPCVEWPASIFMASVLLTVAFQVTPDLPQSLYWAQGMHSLVLPMTLGTFLGAILLKIRDQDVGSGAAPRIAGAGLLAFLAGGFGETYVSLQTLVLVMMLMYTLLYSPPRNRGRMAIAIGVCLTASLLAMLIIILSPGNTARQSHFPPTPSLPAMLAISLQAFLSYLGRIFTSSWKIWQLAVLFISALLAGSGFLFGQVSDVGKKMKGRGVHLAFTAALTLGLMYACFVPSAYGMSTTPPDRTLFIPTFILAAGMAACGWLAGAGWQAFILNTTAAKPRPTLIVRWVLFLAFAIHLHVTVSGILSLQPEYSRFARISDKAEEIILQARQEGRDWVEIPEVHNPFGLSDFGAGTNEWLDDAVNQYYGIHVIINKNLNLRYK
jgi:hypothetical protein